MCNFARTFYSQLYTPDPTDPVATTTLLASLSTRPKIREEDNAALLSHITQLDLQAIIDHSPRGRAPGTMGSHSNSNTSSSNTNPRRLY